MLQVSLLIYTITDLRSLAKQKKLQVERSRTYVITSPQF
jgi:hypothetical protein